MSVKTLQHYISGNIDDKHAGTVAGAAGGASAGLIIIALVVISVVLYRRKSCSKGIYLPEILFKW